MNFKVNLIWHGLLTCFIDQIVPGERQTEYGRREGLPAGSVPTGAIQYSGISAPGQTFIVQGQGRVEAIPKQLESNGIMRE